MLKMTSPEPRRRSISMRSLTELREYVTFVRTCAQHVPKTKTNFVPGHALGNFQITTPSSYRRQYIEQFTKQWKQPAMELFDNIHAILKADLAKLVEEHFAEMGKGNAKQSVL
jgi:hypothetical protein